LYLIITIPEPPVPLPEDPPPVLVVPLLPPPGPPVTPFAPPPYPPVPLFPETAVLPPPPPLKYLKGAEGPGVHTVGLA